MKPACSGITHRLTQPPGFPPGFPAIQTPALVLAWQNVDLLTMSPGRDQSFESCVSQTLSTDPAQSNRLTQFVRRIIPGLTQTWVLVSTTVVKKAAGVQAASLQRCLCGTQRTPENSSRRSWHHQDEWLRRAFVERGRRNTQVGERKHRGTERRHCPPQRRGARKSQRIKVRNCSDGTRAETDSSGS